MTPAMNAPMIAVPPATFAWESGSQFKRAVTGKEASAPTSANRYADGTVRRNDGDIYA